MSRLKNRKTKQIEIFCDSGAHALYNQMFRKASFVRDYSYADTPEFWDYIHKYCHYLQQYGYQFNTKVTMDVIFNPERTWEVMKMMEGEYGLSLLPVFHFGEDIKWLYKYMDNYDYIGIGGLGQEVPKSKFVYYADRIFKDICDDNGFAKIRTHGFAMTSIDLMLRYPWYSVDSTSWLVSERYALLIVPKMRNGKFFYGISPEMVSVSMRHSKSKNHMRHFSPMVRKAVHQFAEEVGGFKLGKSEFITVPDNFKIDFTKLEYWSDKENRLVEKIIEPGFGNSMQIRNTINTYYFKKLEEYTLLCPRQFKAEMGSIFE